MMNKSSKIFVATGDRSSQQRLGEAPKALLRGSVSGRYEDLRGFIHHLETADGFLMMNKSSKIFVATGDRSSQQRLGEAPRLGLLQRIGEVRDGEAPGGGLHQ